MKAIAFELSMKSLICFRSIMSTGSATAAAQELQITQPAVSRLLKRLEEFAGAPLFIRDKGRLVPTQEAVSLYPEVDLALQSVERVAELTQNLHSTGLGELKIVSPPSFAEGLLSQMIAAFVERYPRINVSLDTQNLDTAIRMIALRAVDCGFVKLPAEYPGLESETIVESGTACVLPSKHALANNESIEVSQLRGEPLILLGKGRNFRAELETVFRKYQVPISIRVETHTVGSACALARSGSGIAIVNEMLAHQYRDERTVIRPFRPDIRHQYGFMYSTVAPMTRVSELFRLHCRQFLDTHHQGYAVRES